jgi:hypothetical protein
MKTVAKTILSLAIIAASASAFAKTDVRDSAVLNSPMVQSILAGLKAEQGLKCKIYKENGSNFISYYIEDNYSMYSASFLCNNGQMAVIKGVLGDGGQTETKSFELIWAN